MPTLDKRIFNLTQTLNKTKRCICIGKWRINPDKIVTWLPKEENNEIYVMFQGQNMGYKLNNREEYLKVKEEMDNYEF